MKDFKQLYRDAIRKHGEAELNALLPKVKSARALSAVSDENCLSAMARCIFQAGFVWKVVDAKWPGFEEAFHGFSPERLASLKPGQVDQLKQDERIIRNTQKIKAVLDNARFVSRVSAEHDGFGRFLAQWPDDDLAGLWQSLSREGSRLGGITGPRFLRNVGKDTYIFSPDVVSALIASGVIDRAPTGKAAQAVCHEAFAQWRAQSGRPWCEISMIAACSV